MTYRPRFSVTFLNRDFTRRVAFPWASVEVQRYSFHAVGGPLSATIYAYGDRLALWEFMEMLRCPVIIYDNLRGKPVWWGKLADVKVSDEKMQTVSIEDMWNNVQCRYTNNLEPKETAFAGHTDSINTYGQKDVAVLGNDLELDQAEQLRDTELERLKYPQVSKPEIATGASMAQLTCRGWWDTAKWQYYSTDEGKEAHEEIDTSYYGREVGEDDRPICAQSFQLGSTVGWDAYLISVRVRKHKDTNNDNFIVDLCTDSGGDPGSSVRQVSLDFTNFSTAMEWVDFELPSAYSLALVTTYWIKCSKAGSISLDECYIVDGDGNEGYQRGVFKIYNTNTSEWVQSKPMDMNFRVMGRLLTTDQISDMITNGTEFFTGVDIITSSGIYKNQFRDGQTSTLHEIEKLLNMGTTNQRRMLARVLPNLHVEVREEPALYASNWKEDAYGRLFDQNNCFVPGADCPVGMWLDFASNIPTSIDTSRLNNANYIFVEQAEYDVTTGIYKVIEGNKTPVYPGMEVWIDG